MSGCCRSALVIFRRELKGFFESPVAYVFLVVFLLLMGFLTFSVFDFYGRGMSDLNPFFWWHPIVFLFLVPAATMGLWAEERRSGTMELLLTMPVTLGQAVVGKFLAAWLFMIIAIVLTCPIVFTVAYLGSPDYGAVLSGYLGSILLAGAYVSVGCVASAFTRNQVISFVISLVACLLLFMAGWEPVIQFFSGWAPTWIVDFVAAFSVMPHFVSMGRGVIDIEDLGYFASVILFMLFSAHLVLENRKSA